MKPVLILQHLSADGPAFLATWLRRRGVRYEVRNREKGQAFPDDLRRHAALAILGGEMSANDPLPSLRQAEALILQAVRDGVPVLGHCLGGQLMARALGATVSAGPVPEIGWQPMEVLDTATARAWFGASGSHPVFHWHHETFELPAGAERLAGSVACPNQAFAIGPHLAIQFHVEIDRAKLMAWSLDGGARLAEALARHPGSVQAPEAMRAWAMQFLVGQQRLAARIYARWLSAVTST
jgi:GMP synthase-like glutamine amidotransferase